MTADNNPWRGLQWSPEQIKAAMQLGSGRYIINMIPLHKNAVYRYPNICYCAAYPWLHHRKIGRCGK